MQKEKALDQSAERSPILRSMLTPVQGMILWLVGLVFFLFTTLLFWNHLLSILVDVWSFQYGDRSVRLDPTTSGMPLMGSAVMGSISLLILLRILAQPLWRTRR